MKTFLSVFFFVILSGVTPFSWAEGEKDALRENFRAAPTILPGDPLPLKGMPLWHTNSLLTSELIHEMMTKGKESGFAGYAFLPVDSTKPNYLSDDYFKAFGQVLDEAKEADMKIIFYDDIGFPSGSAGGELRREFPEDVTKRLDKFEWDAEGPAEFRAKVPVPLTDEAVYGKEGGVLQAAVAMNRETFERINIKEGIRGDEIVWNVPEGKWRIFLFVCVPDPFDYVDYLSPKSVKRFMSLTYDRFDRQFPGAFGSIIPMVFFDDIPTKGAEGDRNWTLGFNDEFRRLYGRDPDLDYPALFYSIGDETPSARCRLWSTRNILFADGYPKAAHEWCARRGVLSSGHPQGPYTIGPIDMCGDAMLTHRWSDVPLLDAIHYYGHGRDGFKIPTGAAINFDKDVVAVEIYGDFRDHNFDERMMFRAAMEIFARGGNFILPHGAWSDPGNCYINPVIGWQNPRLKDILPAYGDWLSRVSLLLRHSRHVAEIGVLYPIDALKAGFHFQFDFLTGFPEKGDFPTGLFIPEETDYLAVGSDLTSRIYRDFTFLHPTVLDDRCRVVTKDGTTFLRLDNERNFEEYRIVVLTGADVISRSNMAKVLEFYRAGGKVLATTRLPSRSAEGDADAEVCAAVEEIFGMDPAEQVFREALRTGQEDIVLPESFRKVREFNQPGFYRREPKNPVLYETPIYRSRGETISVSEKETATGAEAADRLNGKVIDAVFLPRPTVDALQMAVDLLLPLPDVRLIPVDGKPLPVLNVTPRWDYPIEGMLQYIHKVRDGRDFYYLANSSNEDAEFDLQLSGSFRSLEIWNPRTGEIDPIPADRIQSDRIEGRPVTTTRIHLGSVEDLFVVGEPK